MKDVKKTTEAGHLTHIKGFDCEMKVLQQLENFSLQRKLGLKIFHDTEIKQEMLEALCDAFKTEIPSLDESMMKKFKNQILNIEIDILAVSRNALLVIEVKSNPNEWGKAFEQLGKSEYVLTLLLEILGLKGFQIRTIFAAPMLPQEDINSGAESANQASDKLIYTLQLNAKRNHVFLFDINQVHSKPIIIESLLESQLPDFDQKSLSRLFATLAFLKCSSYYHKISSYVKLDGEKLLDCQSEVSSAKHLVMKMKTQTHMEKSKCLGTEPRTLENFFLWLDPIQKRFLDDSCNEQLLIGTAGTGKTILAQLKVLQVFKSGNQAKILILLPNEVLVNQYKTSLLEQVASADSATIKIMTASSAMKTCLKSFKPTHIIIDEFSAVSSLNSLCLDDILDYIKEQQKSPYLLLTFDYHQRYVKKHTDVLYYPFRYLQRG